MRKGAKQLKKQLKALIKTQIQAQKIMYITEQLLHIKIGVSASIQCAEYLHETYC